MTSLNVPAVTHLLAYEPPALTIGPFGTDLTDAGTFCEYLEQATLVSPQATGCGRGPYPDVEEWGDDVSKSLDEQTCDPTTETVGGAQPATDDNTATDPQAAPTGSESHDGASEIDKPDEVSDSAGQAEEVHAEQDDPAKKTARLVTQSEQVKGADSNGPEQQLDMDKFVATRDTSEQGRAGDPHSESHQPSAPDDGKVPTEMEGRIAGQEILEETREQGDTRTGQTKHAGQQAGLTEVPISRSSSDQEQAGNERRTGKDTNHRDAAKVHAVDPRTSKNLSTTQFAEANAPNSLTSTEIAVETWKSPGELSVKSADEGQVGPRVGTTQVAPGAPNDVQTEAPPRVTAGRSVSSSSAGEMQKADASDQAERVRFVQRVARAFQAIAGREGNVRLRLHPPELGSLRLELAVRGGVMTARLEAENTAARNLLLDNLPALRDRLAEQDIRVERFDVDLAGRSPNGSPREPGDRPQYQDGSEHNTGPNKERGQAGESEATHVGHAQSPRHTGNLDVTI